MKVMCMTHSTVTIMIYTRTYSEPLIIDSTCKRHTRNNFPAILKYTACSLPNF